MAQVSENTQRIAKNTLMLYIRMLFSMLVSLYTSRVILNMLGVEDFGIHNVVGGFVSMFSLISSALSSSTSRYLTFELGKGDKESIRKVFSTSLLIHIILAAIIFVAFETVGIWFVNNRMTIPAGRLVAANWAFQASVVSFLVGIVAVPFTSSVIAHERMDAFAYIGIGEVLLKLAVVLFVAHSPFRADKLILYSCLIVCVSVLVQSIYIIFCRWHFNECTMCPRLHREYFRGMCSFAGWNFIGCSAAILKGQGVNMLLNIFHGPVVNAAYGIASTVNNAVSSFANNFMTALNPQITKSYAAGKRDYMLSLVFRGSRFSYYLIYVFALPLILETHFVLDLWLGKFPEQATNFVRLMLILSLVDILSNALITTQNATGRIRNYQLVVGGMLMMNFPLSYLALKLGCAPLYVFVIAIGVALCCLALRLLFLKKNVGLRLAGFLREVCLNIAAVSVLSLMPALTIRLLMQPGWPRFLTVVAVSVITTLFVILYVGCSRDERAYLYGKVHNVWRRLTRR